MNILEIGIEKGREDGLQQGIKQSQLDIAKNLLDILSDEVIAEKTGLDIEAVQKLRQEQKK